MVYQWWSLVKALSPHFCIASTEEVEAGESRTGGCARLPLRFETSLGYAGGGLNFKKIKIEQRTK